jgi:light-regulated signal transduction histidine kinase (bacteriophytochrome)
MKATSAQTASRSLEATVNLLQDELVATNREVLLLTLDLEQRVTERTAELARSNQELLKEVRERVRAEAEIKRLNQDLQARATQMEIANEELEAFSSSVSHDLRNPLAKIVAFSSLLEDASFHLGEEKRRRYLSQICETAHRMAAMIDSLLRLSHSSQVSLEWKEVDLNGLVASVVAELQLQSQGNQIEWIRGPLPTVPGDVSLLRQVFTNLLLNALKYSRGERIPKITIQQVLSNHEEWTVFVRDNGVGFDSDKADKLFGAFQRFHSTEKFEGIGLGLLNVKRIVVRHGGRVWAESKPGEGATFYVSLPKARLPEV